MAKSTSTTDPQETEPHASTSPGDGAGAASAEGQGQGSEAGPAVVGDDALALALPDENPRALAAEGATDDEGAGESAAPAPPEETGAALFTLDGFEVRHVGTRWERHPQGTELVDAKGRTFDPRVHVADADGRPRITKKGQLRLLGGRAGRAAEAQLREAGDPSALPPLTSTVPGSRPDAMGGTNAGAIDSGPVGPGDQANAALPPFKPERGVGSEENDRAAEALAPALIDTLTGSVAMVVGPQGNATSEERSAMVAGWAGYLKTIDCSYVPPWAVAAMTMQPYVMRVATDERTREKFAKPKPDPMDAETEAVADTGSTFAGYPAGVDAIPD